MLIEAHHLEFADGHWRATGSATDLPLPESIQSVVAARIDGLPLPEKTTLQRASVIGERFAFDELLALYDEAGTGPEALVRKGFFVLDRDDPSSQSLRFKHLLIRDVAYGSLSKADRASVARSRRHSARGRKSRIDTMSSVRYSPITPRSRTC